MGIKSKEDEDVARRPVLQHVGTDRRKRRLDTRHEALVLHGRKELGSSAYMQERRLAQCMLLVEWRP